METEKKRKTYDQQFKIDAVNLVVNGGRSVEEAARELGISANSLHRWKQAPTRKGSEAFPGKGRLSPQVEDSTRREEELRRLRRELAEAKEDRDILKKADMPRVCKKICVNGFSMSEHIVQPVSKDN